MEGGRAVESFPLPRSAFHLHLPVFLSAGNVHPMPRGGTRRIGVFGGSFNPVHSGHLLVAEEARARLRLDRVLFVVAGDPPHKPPGGLAPAADRLALVRAAVRGNPAFEASDIEIRRKGKSFTVDTLEALRRRLPGARLHLIVGSDAAADLPGWREPERILRLARLVIAGRPGARAPRGAFLRRIRPVLLSERLLVSSSEIRARLARGASARYLAPDGVLREIRRRRLYGAR